MWDIISLYGGLLLTFGEAKGSSKILNLAETRVANGGSSISDSSSCGGLIFLYLVPVCVYMCVFDDTVTTFRGNKSVNQKNTLCLYYYCITNNNRTDKHALALYGSRGDAPGVRNGRHNARGPVRTQGGRPRCAHPTGHRPVQRDLRPGESGTGVRAL